MNIHHLVDIDTPGSAVWSALTEEKGLASWWSTEVRTPPAAVGVDIEFTFLPEFSPTMRITQLDDQTEVGWQCVAGHEPWQDSTFRFELAPLDGTRTRVRFWQDYAIPISDDAYGIYNFNWGYYLESLRLACTTGTGKPFIPE